MPTTTLRAVKDDNDSRIARIDALINAVHALAADVTYSGIAVLLETMRVASKRVHSPDDDSAKELNEATFDLAMFLADRAGLRQQLARCDASIAGIQAQAAHAVPT